MHGMYDYDHFTGTRTEAIKKSIEDLYNLGVNHIIKQMSTASIEYFSALRYLWCSNNAVEFYNKYATPLVDAINNGATDIINICKKIEEAHNFYAEANGSELVSVETKPYKLLGLPSFYDNLNGVVGMNIEKVHSQTLQYKLYMNTLLSQLDDLPIKIDFFDPGQNQQLAYQRMLNTIKENIQTQFTGIIDDITNAEQTETNNIKLSQEYAIEALNNQNN